MTLLQLKYVITIADCGSMNEAAKQLYLSQPSLSETVMSLEEEIGIEIFIRTNRGIRTTIEGEEFLGYEDRWWSSTSFLMINISAAQKAKKSSVCPCSIIPLR